MQSMFINKKFQYNNVLIEYLGGHVRELTMIDRVFFAIAEICRSFRCLAWFSIIIYLRVNFRIRRDPQIPQLESSDIIYDLIARIEKGYAIKAEHFFEFLLMATEIVNRTCRTDSVITTNMFYIRPLYTTCCKIFICRYWRYVRPHCKSCPKFVASDNPLDTSGGL